MGLEQVILEWAGSQMTWSGCGRQCCDMTDCGYSLKEKASKCWPCANSLYNNYNISVIWSWAQGIDKSHRRGCCLEQSGPWFNIKISSYQYRKSHCGDKTILRPSYLHNGISYLIRWHLYIESGPWHLSEAAGGSCTAKNVKTGTGNNL